ncbi:MAG: citramalate synthase [Dehalococcoidia bacterium]
MSVIQLYDTTLRDGAQYEGISFSVEDKINILKKLDELGVHFVEGGWPGSNPKDAEFFKAAQEVNLNNSTLTAFGSTRRAGINVKDDPQIQSLLDSQVSVITLVGKSWDLHVTEILETTLEENLSMIKDSIEFLRQNNKRVFFDAEHFFDGYKKNPEYAMDVISVAAQAGAECIVLCDTNGGAIPSEIASIISLISDQFDVHLGIHTHNDTDMAVASSLVALDCGAIQVQGTINGYGERCGNANLISLIANLKLKKNINCISDQQLQKLSEISRYVAEIANMPPISNQPFVGSTAFAHKGGLHASAVQKVEDSYQHVSPQTVGNEKRVLVSELSGKSNILWKTEESLGINIEPSKATELLTIIKEKESQGYQYEGAEASFELLVLRTLPKYSSPFNLVDFMTIIEKKNEAILNISSQVMVKVEVDGRQMHTASAGDGPVNALDNALRKALLEFYPEISNVRLNDYKVRVVDQQSGTGSIVRVLIESTDGEQTWTTVGSSENIIEASWIALSDSLEWWLLKRNGNF